MKKVRAVRPRAEANKRRLNDQVIRRLKPRQDRPYLVWDTKQAGLVVQVQPTGRASYKVIYARNGRPRWYSIAPVNAIELKEARRLAGRVMYQVAEGGDPAADRRAQRSLGSFEELASAYLERFAKKKNRSWKQADALVTKHLLPRWSKMKAADINRGDVKLALSKVASLSVANQVLAAASAIFNWAIKEEVAGIKANPCQKIERNESESRERVLSDGELPRFWKAFDECHYTRGRALKFLLLVGQRPGEVAHMRAEHIVDGWWEMPGTANGFWSGTKNGRTHRVWIPKAARDILTEMEIGKRGYVFAGLHGGPIGSLQTEMAGICKRLEVERATPHDLRRTHGSTVTALGFGRDAMNRIQNHVEGGIASVYDRHQYGDENKQIMETVADKLMNVIDNKVVIPLAKAG